MLCEMKAAFLPHTCIPSFPRSRGRHPSTTLRRPKMLQQNASQPSTPTHDSDPLTSTLTSIRRSPIVLCIRMQNPTIALAAAIAAVRGGLRCVEVAMTTPHATRIMRDLAAACPDAVVGAGTVLTHMQVRQACDAGAKFALSPVTDADIIAECHRSGMLAVPGAATPTECFRAYEMGARVVKVFPINLYGGIAFVKAMQGPLPQIPLLATSGIDTESLSQYLSAPNVLAVGASRQILPKEALENKDWTGVTRRARVWARIAEQYVADCDALSPSSRPGSTHSDTVT